MSDIKLPALPDALPAKEWQHNMYTTEQLRAYGLAAAEEVREACAKFCDEWASHCSASIRAINIGAE